MELIKTENGKTLSLNEIAWFELHHRSGYSGNYIRITLTPNAMKKYKTHCMYDGMLQKDNGKTGKNIRQLLNDGKLEERGAWTGSGSVTVSSLKLSGSQITKALETV